MLFVNIQFVCNNRMKKVLVCHIRILLIIHNRFINGFSEELKDLFWSHQRAVGIIYLIRPSYTLHFPL